MSLFPASLSTRSLWDFRYLFLALAAALLLWNLDYAPAWNPDEGRYVSASLEMIAPLDGSAPDWVVPHLNTLPRLNKPPLVYWSAATLFQLLGVSVASARLVSALAAIGVMLVLWRLGAVMFGEKTGILAALVWVSSTLPFILARLLSTDMLLAFSTSLALLGIYQIAARENKSKTPISAVGISGIGLALALLAKGPVGVVLPLLILLAWLALVFIRIPQNLKVDGFIRRLFVPALIASIIAATLAAPWCLAIARSQPAFLRNFLFGENLARFTGSTFYHDAKPFWFYVPILIVGLLPWTAFLWPALKMFCAGFSLRPQNSMEKNSQLPDTQREFSRVNARLFLWLWAAAVVVLFSISKTKLITYVLPALPPLVLLISDALSGAGARENKKALRAANGITICVLVLLACGLCAAFMSPKLLGDKIIPQGDSTAFIFLFSLVLIGGAGSLWRAQRAAETAFFLRHVAATLVVTGALLFLVLVEFMHHFAQHEDVSPMLLALMPFVRPGDKILQFKTFQPSAMFYTRAPSTIIDFVNTSGLDEAKFNASSFFPKEHEVLKSLFKNPHHTYVLVRWKHRHWPALSQFKTIARNNDFYLLSNRPAPAGFHYDYITSAKRARKLSPACRNLQPDC